MKKPSFIKLNVWHSNFKNETNVILNLETDVASIHISDITETIGWANEGKIKNYFSKTKCFKHAVINLEDLSNKWMNETKMMLFDFLRTTKGVFYIDFLDEKQNSIEIYSGPAIPFDDEDAKTFFSTTVNYRNKFQIYIGKQQLD